MWRAVQAGSLPRSAPTAPRSPRDACSPTCRVDRTAHESLSDITGIRTFPSAVDRAEIAANVRYCTHRALFVLEALQAVVAPRAARRDAARRRCEAARAARIHAGRAGRRRPDRPPPCRPSAGVA